MHISLDSALGRQRRLNQVGETISSIAAPTAAYSLRSLTGGDPKAVRVRRESDNHEQDFTVSEVSSGALVNFVNAQVTAPLDIQELDSAPPPGRTGNFLIAKAAYSLRSLGTRQATIPNDAAPLNEDTVVPASGKYVCQVRSLTGDIKSFTATEVSDGTLVDFVLGNTVSLVNNRAYFDGSSNYISYSNAADFSISANEAFETTFNFVYVENSNLNRRILSATDSGGGNNVFEIGKDGSAASDDAINLGFGGGIKTGSGPLASGKEYFVKIGYDGSSFFCEIDGVRIDSRTNTTTHSGVSLTGNLIIGARHDNAQKSTGVISNISFSKSGTTIFSVSGHGTTASNWTSDQSDSPTINGTLSAYTGQEMDGFVKTWYDQSVSDQAGNTPTGNHATQSTADSQPKIVSAGSLVVDSSGVPELEFDGSDDVLSAGTGFASSSKTIFCVNNPDSLSSNGLFAFGSSQTDRFFAQYTSNLIRTEINGAQAGVSAATQKNLTTNLHTTDISVGLNGGSFTTTSASFSGVSASAELKIGQRFGTAFTDNFDGTIQEFIAYNSDQTDNRTAIEANMGEFYSIDLPSGVDPLNNEVNGFVSTWYDQSGNGNNATQATASKQPKIVNAGSLISDGILFGANINLPLSGTGLDIFKNVSHGNIFSVLKPLDTGTSGDRYFTAGINAGTNARFLFADSQDTSASFRIGGRALDSDNFSDEEGTTTHSNAVSLLTGFIDYENTTATLFLNGTQINTATLANMSAFGSTSNTSSALAAIGDLQSSGALTSDFNAKEMIIYNTNQSSNRTALENNIKSHYGIS